MKIIDRLYGQWEVNEPVLVELMQSRAMQRLKGIAQYGVPDAYYHLKNYSRFEHSVGVMLLLRKLGASLEEQIAGLLHDVSHTAFSHVVDWVLGDGKTENYQDEQHEAVMKRSDVPKILKRHGLAVDAVMDYHRFGLLERELPDLCADRLDYALREIPEEIGKRLIAALRVKHNQIVMADLPSALLLGREFLKLQMNHWGGFEAASRYRLFANVLREALEMKVIEIADFEKDDEWVINKVLGSGISDLLNKLNILKRKSLAELPKSEVVVHKKFRYVDPCFIDGEKLTRASDAESEFMAEIAAARQNNEKGVRIAQPIVSSVLHIKKSRGRLDLAPA